MKSAIGSPLLSAITLAGIQISAHAADLSGTQPPAPAPVIPSFFRFSDTTLSYRYEASATDTGNSIKFPKNIANISHADEWTYGTNFVSVDLLQSTGANPAAPATAPFTGVGSTEVYAIYRGALSGNALTNSHMFSLGPIKDVSFGFGGDYEAHNTSFAPNKRALVAGPKISFNVPGYLTLQADVYKEWNHNGTAQMLGLPGNPDYNPFSGQVNFRTTAEFETTYMQPLTFTGLPLSFSGFTNVILPKGKDGFGHNTRTEVLSSNRLVLDAGSYFGHPRLVDIFVGYKFWLNKFGDNSQFGSPGYTPGAHESTVFAGIAVHLQ